MNTPSDTLAFAVTNSEPRRRFLLFGAIYVVLWIGSWYSARLLDSFGVVSLWFLPAGLRFSCLLILGWPGFLLELTVQFVFALMQLTQLEGSPLREILSTQTLWRLYNLLASLIVTAAVIFPLRRRMGDSWDFTRPRHSALFFVTSLLVSTLSALVGTVGLLQLEFITQGESSDVLAKWLIGDFIGIITLSPLLIARVAPGLLHYLQYGCWRRQHMPDASGKTRDLQTIIVAVPSLMLVFGIPWSMGLSQHFPLIALLLLLPLAAVALHSGLRSALLAVIVLDGGLVLLISLFDKQGQALHYQLVMIAIALVGLSLGGAVEARNRVIARHRDFATISNDLLWETDRMGRFLKVSGQLAEDLALSPGQSWPSVAGRGLVPNLALLEETLARQQSFQHLEIVLQGNAENPYWIQLSGLPLLDETGELIGYRGTAVDVSSARLAESLLSNYNEELLKEVAERTSELRQTVSELATKEQHLQVLLAAAPVGVLEFDQLGNCHYINTNGCALAGCTPEEAQGLPMLEFVHPDDRSYVEFVWDLNRQSPEVRLLEFRMNRTDQRCTAHWINLFHLQQPVDGTIMVLTSTSAHSQQDERLWSLAHHDALTNLPNRNLFWDRLEQSCRLAKRHENCVALLWIDLDEFKAVNDTFGHPTGDALLQQVAQRLKSKIRDSDTVARMGGDEFAVIMPGVMGNERAVQVANELVAMLAEPFTLPQGSVQISGSIGIALYPLHAATVETLTQCADMALYAAKNAGRNQVHLWSEG